MATLEVLKSNLRLKALASSSTLTQPLSDSQYSAGFDILMQSSGQKTYQDFIIPQLSLLLGPLFNSRIKISALEIGPGPQSVLGHLPDHLKEKIKNYEAYEPNNLFATRLEEWLCSTLDTGPPLPCLEKTPDIHRSPFVLDTMVDTSIGTRGHRHFDIILFCHSLYGMEPKRKFVERALEMLAEQPGDGLVVVVHRDRTLYLDGLTCHRSASFPDAIIRLANDDNVLDRFTSFIAGLVMQDVALHKALQVEWRKVCRDLGRREEAFPNHLLFSSPNMMMAFTRQATKLPHLTARIPSANEDGRVKNREARLHHPASIVRPTEIEQVQHCVRWARKYGMGLTIIGGGHSGHCRWPNVVSVDMGAFDQIHVLKAGVSGSGPDDLVVVEAGCKSGDIVHKSMAAGLTVPLGARPSIGAGLWLQGGIGHLARLHGLACDAIVGAVMVSVVSGQLLCVGRVPSQHRPAGCVHPENEEDLLWAIKGAGTNFGIVVSVTFIAHAAPTYLVRNWVVPLSDKLEAQLKLSEFDECATRELPRNCSADAYLYWDTGRLHLGISMFESSTPGLTSEMPVPLPWRAILESQDKTKSVDGIGLFETEMYMSEMHGGHAGGKTSSFKRCLFLKRIGSVKVVEVLVAAIETRPSPLCYLHLLQGGGAVADTKESATAFGCRDWNFACVVTGVWSRDLDDTDIARAAMQWVYKVTEDLLPLSSGAYSADLGPDPRDAALATKAFGPNRPRLARLKRIFDPGNVLAYACPLPKTPMEPRLIILVTGESCAGKDYCTDIWVSVFNRYSSGSLSARAISISDATKQEYAAATGADVRRLLSDRAYKEQHRPALTSYFQDQVSQRPRLPEEHFLNTVYGAVDTDVLLISGMRDEAPVASFSHLVPDSRLLEVRVTASKGTMQLRRGCQAVDDGDDGENDQKDRDGNNCPDFIIDNEKTGSDAVKRFCESYLLPYLHEDLQQLSDMVRPVPNFPCMGIDFRHVLDISQREGGLSLCTALLESHFRGNWTKVNAVACCEIGGFIFASALASRVNIPLVLIREAGKLPQPTISATKSPSHITSSSSSSSSGDLTEKKIEMSRDVIPKGASVLVVDDVLATGETLCAVLRLLREAGVSAGDMNVIVVAEFPVHRGRELLRRRGFCEARVQSLLVFGGA